MFKVTNFFGQKKVSFDFFIKNSYFYETGSLYFFNNQTGYSLINLKTNAIYDGNNNFIFAIDPFLNNRFSGNFNSGQVNLFYFAENSVKPLLLREKFYSTAAMNGLGFSGLKHSNIPSDYVEEDFISFSVNIEEEPNFEIYHSITTASDDLFVTFKLKPDNNGPLTINGLTLDEQKYPHFILDQEIVFPKNIYPGEEYTFRLISIRNINRQEVVSVSFLTDFYNIQYDAVLEVAPILLTGSGFSTSLEPQIIDQIGLWQFNVNNFFSIDDDSIYVGNVYFQLSGLGNGNNSNNYLHKNTNSSNYFGYEPAPYVKYDFENNWSGNFNESALYPIKHKDTGIYFDEDIGNLKNLYNFKWSNNWNDSLILNKENYAGLLFQINNTGFTKIKDVNLFLYSKNGSSGLLNYSIYNVSFTGGANPYEKLLSGLGWTTGTLSNCCGNSGFPKEFPSGFPFKDRDIYGFFSGFGFGKLSGYLITGNSIYSGNINVDQEKLSIQNRDYYAPVSNNIKINTEWNVPNTGLYMILFNADPNIEIENETGIFWPKMWPYGVDLAPEAYLDFAPILEKYLYESGYPISGYPYSGISGLKIIKTFVSDDNLFQISGIDYNPCLSINQKINSGIDLISGNYFNIYNRFNYIINIYRFINNIDIISNDFKEECGYLLSMNGVDKTGIIGIKKNIYRNLENY